MAYKGSWCGAKMPTSPSGSSTITWRIQKTLKGDHGTAVGADMVVRGGGGAKRRCTHVLQKVGATPAFLLPTLMSARSGLQRRRPPGWERHESTPYASEDEEPSRPGSSGLRGHAHVVEKSSGTGSIAAIDMQSGHRYAYDPRDVSDEHETMAHPTLTLMEEVLLLGLKDRQGYLSFWNDSISYTLRGCILMELALRGRISVMRHPDNKLCHPANRLVEVRDTKHTGDPILDETLRILKSNPPAGITEWLDLLSGTCTA